MSKRLSICYAAPGQNLLPSAGPTRNVLNLANALSRWADVTVAFRSICEPVGAGDYRVVAIDPHAVPATDAIDDTATRGPYPLRHLSYCRTLRSFPARLTGSYDVVLEKGWRLSGYLLEAFRRRGTPGVLIENDVRFWTAPVTNLESIAKYALHSAAHLVAGRCSRRASAVIAETEELKTLLVERRGLCPERVEVVGLGIDHALFRPMDQRSARRALNISPDAIVLLYSGAMDEYHDLEPLIEAMGSVNLPTMELHMVGNGEYRIRCEEKARHLRIKAKFYGHVAHSTVPTYIAAADLCLAPYRTSAFRDGLLPFSTLKVPEYMSCGRPAVTVPSGAVSRLVQDGVSGFLFANDKSAWTSFLRTMPSREQLARMGHEAANAVASVGWDKTAMRYLEVCERLVANRSDS
jgi:glycosyltransferase involved in cell wall biosynthesis